MNTPKTSKPKRYQINPNNPNRPDGTYATGLWNERYTFMIGRLTTYWPCVEDAMIGILEDLMGGRNTPARQIFRSIYSNQARRKIMLALLQRSKINLDKDSYYDNILDEFAKLNKNRNSYVHGMWYTRPPFPTGDVFLSEESVDDHHWLEARPVPYKEIEQVMLRMTRLNTKVQLRHKRPQDEQLPPPWQDKRPPLRV